MKTDVKQFNNNYCFYSEILMTLSLIPYIFTSYPFTYNGWIGICVFSNGALYHISKAFNIKLTKIFRYNDILFNIFACIYINIFTHKQPFTFLITLLSTSSYVANIKYNSTIIHILLVQCPLCLLLYIYEFPIHNKLINYNNYCKLANGSL